MEALQIREKDMKVTLSASEGMLQTQRDLVSEMKGQFAEELKVLYCPLLGRVHIHACDISFQQNREK